MDVISRIYRSKGGKKKIKEVPTHTIHYGYIYDGEEIVDEVLVMVMRAPKTFTGEDFAYLPMIERDEPLTISQYTLKNMIYQTIFSIAVNDNNKLMTGELFEIKNNCLKIVSLDGHRIAIRKMPLKKDYSDRKVVVPGKTLNEISKILSGEMDDVVSIFFTNNHILFEFDQTMVCLLYTSRCV